MLHQRAGVRATDEEFARRSGCASASSRRLAAGDAVPSSALAVVAAYFPLHSVPGVGRCWTRPGPTRSTSVLTQQVREPAEERRTARLHPGADADRERRVAPGAAAIRGKSVSALGEDRSPEDAAAVRSIPAQQFPAAAFRDLGKTELDMLIAGCGTGQHAIETAQRFAGARVLAIDLSLTSLAYAERKTRAARRPQHRICPGRHPQARLDRPQLRSHRVAGVLHHLADPFAGWRMLLSLLRPGGFMAVGLYSEIARGATSSRRAPSSPSAAIGRRRRHPALPAGSPRCGRALQERHDASGDFFSTSDCRDLLFHVQEHRLTIPGSPPSSPRTSSHFSASISITSRRSATARSSRRQDDDRSRLLGRLRARASRHLFRHVPILGAEEAMKRRGGHRLSGHKGGGERAARGATDPPQLA